MSEIHDVGNIELQGTGENLNTWGIRLNAFGLKFLADMAKGFVEVELAGDHTLSSTYNADAEYRHASIRFVDGGLTEAPTISVVAQQNFWLIDNKTPFAITIDCGGLKTAAVRAGLLTLVFCDGVDCFAQDLTLDQIKPPAAPVDFNGKRAKNAAVGTDLNDLVTKSQLDGVVGAASAAASASELAASNSATAAAGSALAANNSANASFNSADAASISETNAAASAAAAALFDPDLLTPLDTEILVVATELTSGKIHVLTPTESADFAFPADPAVGQAVRVIDGDAVSETVAINLTSTATINGSNGPYSLKPGADQTFVFLDSNWKLITPSGGSGGSYATSLIYN